jgi:predicted GNAT superfamily acetyltransferase
MGEGDLDIRTLESASDMATIGNVFQQVWGTATPIVTVELLMAISHAGGYVAGAFESGNAVGASFGFLADHQGHRALHSHVTGILPGVQHGGVGRALKHHQRDWAAERGIDWIVWTFDPLVRRNAWFNIEVIGGHVTDYLADFYGPMEDSINAHDESDRLVVAWPTSPDVGRPTVAAGSTVTEVATPDDIVVLRRTDPSAASEWRRRVRDQLAPLIDAGGVVTGFTRDGCYVVEHAST